MEHVFPPTRELARDQLTVNQIYFRPKVHLALFDGTKSTARSCAPAREACDANQNESCKASPKIQHAQHHSQPTDYCLCDLSHKLPTQNSHSHSPRNRTKARKMVDPGEDFGGFMEQLAAEQAHADERQRLYDEHEVRQFLMRLPKIRFHSNLIQMFLAFVASVLPLVDSTGELTHGVDLL